MNRIYIAIALIAVSVAGAVWTHIAFQKETDALISGLHELIDFAEDGGEQRLKTQTDDFLQRWNKSSALLHILTIHSEMDSAEQHINSLPDLLEIGDLSEYKLACIEAIAQLKNLQNSEKLSLDNILRICSDFTFCSQMDKCIPLPVVIIE